MFWWLFGLPKTVSLRDIRFPLSGDLRGWTNSLITSRESQAVERILLTNEFFAAQFKAIPPSDERIHTFEATAKASMATDSDREIVRNLLDRLR